MRIERTHDSFSLLGGEGQSSQDLTLVDLHHIRRHSCSPHRFSSATMTAVCARPLEAGSAS